MTIADELRVEIERAYLARGDRLGWRLLYSPVSVLEQAEVAFVGLNPGGSYVDPTHPSLACPDGTSAYVTERWKDLAPGQDALQKQVRLLFAKIGVAPQEVLAGNLVPFRSPNWDSLTDKNAALEFGQRIWRRILAHARPKLVVAMGSPSATAISNVLGAKVTTVPIGWGAMTATQARTAEMTFVGLPHLSRFQLFGRAASEPVLDRLFADWRG